MIVFFITSPFYFVCRSAPTVYPQQPAVSGKLLSSVSILCKCWLMLRSPFDTPSIANIVKAVNTNYIPGVKKVMVIELGLMYNYGMRNTDYCSICKVKNVPLMKYSYSKKYDIQYHSCRDCNNTKLKSYMRTTSGKAVVGRARTSQRKKFPEKYAAVSAVNYAVKTGKLVKPDYCQFCSRQSTRLEGHHRDYSKQLDVLWLCPPCHSSFHKYFHTV